MGAGPNGTIIFTYKDGTGGYTTPIVNDVTMFDAKVWQTVVPHGDEYDVHEMLHAFGFDHVNDTRSIMYPGGLPHDPMQQDLDSIRWKYKRNPGAVVNAGEDRD